MKPDRSNYEIWMIDLLDGRLDDVRRNELMEFLGENPDLREEFDALVVSPLSPPLNSFPSKEKLIRSASELPVSQVEYLSVAYLENDISPEQFSDLESYLGRNPENRKVFDLIQKTRLKPPQVRYINKNKLIKYYLGDRIRRISVIGLSAAATIAILISGYFLLRKVNVRDQSIITNEISLNKTPAEPFIVRKLAIYAPRDNEQSKFRDKENPEIAIKAAGEEDKLSGMLIAGDAYSSIVRSEIPEKSAVLSMALVNLEKPQDYDFLMNSNNNFVKPVYDIERSRLSRFIARNFRQKLLKSKIYDESPLRTYEIAEAGIDGLNKLLGWEMALIKTNNEEGDVKSVYFSSRVLKFNAPVRKSESEE